MCTQEGSGELCMVDFISILHDFDWRDALDIVIITFFLYKIILLVKGTRAMAAILGLGLLLALYFIASLLGLYSTVWLLRHVVGSIFLVVIILFQKDIRRALGDMGTRRFWKHSTLDTSSLEELVSACVEMARLHIGALIVLERSIALEDMIRQDGVRLDAALSHRLLFNIFYPKAPMHDGAVIISKGRISAAACILPLAVVQGESFGTRHRAALGITEETDALCIVISEERGEIVVAEKGQLSAPLSAARLTEELGNAL